MNRKKILITGGSGFLGWNLCRILSKQNNELIACYHHNPTRISNIQMLKCNLGDEKELVAFFKSIKPDSVFHLAAIGDPHTCQQEPILSKKINLDATILLSKLCADHNSSFLFTSTDLVFDGKKGNYLESDEPNPLSLYGEYKVLAETSILKHYPESSICRMPLMFGEVPPRARNLLKALLDAMKNKQTLKLFTDEFRSLLGGKSAAKGLVIAMDKSNGLLHLGGKEKISRYDFGALVQKIFKIDSPINPVKSENLKLSIPRPKDVTLNSDKALSLGFNPMNIEEELNNIYRTTIKTL